jgi:hypothetical protein
VDKARLYIIKNPIKPLKDPCPAPVKEIIGLEEPVT